MQLLDSFQPVKIGSRGSPLALVQARLVQRLLGEHIGAPLQEYDRLFPIVTFTTTGDKIKGPLSESGGKGLFVKELDEALADGRIDLAVHSMKDVPTTLPDLFKLCAILEREDMRDGFISHNYDRLEDMPKGAILGTASLRRQAQALRLRPDLEVKLLRGNVGTRLKRLSDGFCDATFLAVAGLNRLGQAEHIRSYISPEQMLPAPAQGAIGIQICRDNKGVDALAGALNHVPTQIAITAERAFLKALDGSCRTPIGGLAQIIDDHIDFKGQALTPNGSKSFEAAQRMALGDYPVETARRLGTELGAMIKGDAGPSLDWT